jgi:ArsR family transcriptional regulator, arsenate/arsenite/antimonite-responsive transcriptional repressor / arsenate reductase (thioredoxin)
LVEVISDILTESDSSVKIESMNTEQIRELKARAAKHAALADPLRLHAVDLLSKSDLSSTELQTRLNIPSNLLAHHLRILEDQGMVIRSRSQGDGRRSYVHLVSEALASLELAPPASARRVVFVCTANSARSQLAAALWQQVSPIPATSAGTHPADRIDPGAVKVARAHHLDLADPRPQSIVDVLHDDDFIVTVCDTAHEELGSMETVHWSVPDPVLVGTPSAFGAAYDDLAHRVSELAPRLSAA